MESLVLNMIETPVSIVSCMRAVTLVMAQKAVVRESYPGTVIRSAHVSMEIPSVIQCTKTAYIPRYTKTLPFTRQNVYIRDQGRCQYCGKKVGLNQFSFDHIIPQCKGGLSCWGNIVIACPRCNSEKGDKTLGRYKRQLIRPPYAPRLDKAAPAHLVNKIAAEIPHETWADFIYWHVILQP